MNDLSAYVALDIPQAERNERGQVVATYHIGAIARPRASDADELLLTPLWQCDHRHRLIRNDARDCAFAHIRQLQGGRMNDSDLPPTLRGIVERARAHERQHGPPWTWSDVQGAPAHLMQLVVMGYAVVVGSDFRRSTYALTEKAFTSPPEPVS